MSRIMVVSFLSMKGLGWVDSLGSAARASRLHVNKLAGSCVHV